MTYAHPAIGMCVRHLQYCAPSPDKGPVGTLGR